MNSDVPPIQLSSRNFACSSAGILQAKKTKHVKMAGNLEAATILVENSKVFENNYRK